MYLNLAVLSYLAAFASAYDPYHEGRELLDDLFKLNRIVGGRSTVRGEFPYQVSLQWGYPPYVPYRHFCGGSIIDEKWILTAGHCINDLPNYGQVVVRAGKQVIKYHEAHEQASFASGVYKHDKYRGQVSPYDIALVKLSTPLKFTGYVYPIKLPQANVIPRGKAILSGWGSISRTSHPSMPDALQMALLPVLDIDQCRRAMWSLGNSGKIDDTNLCTGPLTGGLSACSGDSGGPLVMENETGIRELIGIVSWGVVPCGTYGAPAVFVRVSAFIDWINAVMTMYNN